MCCYHSTKCGTTDCSTVGLVRRGMDLFVCNAALLFDRNIIKCSCLPLSNNFCQRPCCALASHEYFRAFRDLQRPTGRHQVPSRRAHSTFECAPCRHPCTLIKAKAKLSGYFWRCPKCRKKQSVTKDSFLEGAKISPAKLVFLVFYWSSKIAVTTAKEHLDMSSATGVDYYQFMRDICSKKLVRSPT